MLYTYDYDKITQALDFAEEHLSGLTRKFSDKPIISHSRLVVEGLLGYSDNDKEPDELGRRSFTLYCERYDPTNMFNQEISPDGYVQRCQGFFTDPTRFIEKGYKVI